MSCDRARDWLLDAEQPTALDQAPAEVAEHLAHCDACQDLSHRLQALEHAYRDVPLPANVDSARDKFLADLANPPAVTVIGSHADVPSRRLAPRWALAASILLLVGTASLLLWTGSEAQASADVVDRLVDWNIELAGTPSKSERDRIFSDRREHLVAEVTKAKLPDAEHKLAESLLANASWLRENDDPVEAAERFDSVASLLLDQMRSATDRNDRKAARQLARNYDRVTQLGFTAALDKAQASGALDFTHQRRLEKLILRDEARLAALQALLEVAPDASRKEIKRALGLGKEQTGKYPGKPREKSGKTTSQKKPAHVDGSER